MQMHGCLKGVFMKTNDLSHLFTSAMCCQLERTAASSCIPDWGSTGCRFGYLAGQKETDREDGVQLLPCEGHILLGCLHQPVAVA